MKSEVKRLSKDTLVYGISNTLTKFIGVLLIPLYTRVFIPEEYGVIDLLTTSIIVMVIIITCGFDSAIFRFCYEHKDHKKQKELISTIITTLFIIGIVWMILILSFTETITSIMFQNSSLQIAVIISALCLPCEVTSAFIYRVLRLRFQSKTYALMSIINLLLTIMFTIYLILILKIGILGIFMARLMSNIGQTIVGLYIIRQDFAFKNNLQLLPELFKFGLPLMPAALSQWSLNFINRYILLGMCTLAEVGLYSLGSKISSALMIFTLSFQLAWSPFALSIADKENAKQIYAKILNYYLIITCIAAACLTLFGKEIIIIVSTPHYSMAYKVIGLLAGSVVISGAFYILSIGPTIEKKTHLITYSILAGTIINIVASILLIQPWGIVGASCGSLLGYIITSVIIYKMSQKIYLVPYELNKVFIISAGYIVILLYTCLETSHSIYINLGILIAYTVILIMFCLTPKERQVLLSKLPL